MERRLRLLETMNEMPIVDGAEEQGERAAAAADALFGEVDRALECASTNGRTAEAEEAASALFGNHGTGAGAGAEAAAAALFGVVSEEASAEGAASPFQEWQVLKVRRTPSKNGKC